MEFFVLFFLLLLNGIFAMSEIAMVSARKSFLERAAKKGDRAAKKALELSQNPSKLLSTVQIGITLIGIFTGIYSGEKIEGDLENYLRNFETIAPYSETLSVVIILIILTFFSLVLGELVPKRIGLVMPEKISRIFSFPMYWTSVVAAPFIWLLSVATDVLIKIFNVKKSAESNVTEEEIKDIIEEGTKAGAVQEIEQDIVENVFHLGDRKINTLMTPRANIVWINANESPEVIKKSITQSAHKAFPVCRDEINNVMGMLYSKEMLNHILLNETFDMQKMITPAFYLTESTTAYIALEKFRDMKQRIALVVDEFGLIQGILSMNDLVDALVGDLAEQLHEKKEIIPREDGSFLVDAALPLPEFARYFEIDIKEDPTLQHITTVSGLILHLSKKIPRTGDKLSWQNHLLEIIDMDKKRIDKILVKKEETD